MYGKAARLQVPSQSVADAVIAELRPGDDARVKCIPYPLPFSMPHPVPLDARPKRVLFAGRIHPEKGVHYLIEAWKSLPISLQNEWTLRLIGPWRKEQGGAGKQFLEQMIHSGGKNIEVLDPVFSEEELIKQYQSAQIFVYPSMARKGETFGLAVLEAMACGCVPLVSSLPCFGDFIRPGKNGFTFDSQKDPVADELTRALNSLLGYTDLSVLSDSAIMRASQYHLDIIADRFLKDFAELINQ